MKPTVRRIVSLILVCVLVIGLVPQAFATDNDTNTPDITTSPDPPGPSETTTASDTTGSTSEGTTSDIPGDDSSTTGDTTPPDESSTAETTPPDESTSVTTTPPVESSTADTTPPEESSTADTTPPDESTSADTLPPEESSSAPTGSTTETIHPEEEYWLDAIDKGESALDVIYDEYFTQEQLAQMPAAYNARATAHGTHLQACLVWLEYEKTFTHPYGDGEKTISSVALHRVYNASRGDWDIAYCIEPGVPNANSGYDDSQYDANATWGELDKNQQTAIGLAILYGYPNNPDLKTSDVRRKIAYELATYIIIQEICLEWRNSTGTYACTNSSYIDAFGKGELYITSENFYEDAHGKYLRTADYTYGEYDEVMYAYNYISEKMAKHYISPSFTSRFIDDAPTHPMTQSGNQWTTTLTDTNNILSEYSFTNTSDLTFTVSGNKLTVVAKGEGPYNSISPTKTVPTLSSGASLFRIWKTSTDAQEMISVASARNDPVPAYFNLGPATGTVTGMKVTETGTDKGNITIELRQGGTVIKTTTTDSNGNFSFSDVQAGNYTLHESIDGGSKYYCANNDQTVTVTPGGTTTVSITNNLKRGNISGTKSTETGTDKGSITIQLLQGSTVIATTTTDANGNFAFNSIPIGTYTVHEVLPNDSKYYPVNNDQSVTVTYGGTAYVSITNNLKRGNIAGTKSTETGTDKGNITVQLLQGGTVIATTTTDAYGNFAFNSIPIGTYTVHEILPNDSRYYPVNNDQSVTVTYGGTANVSITNNLKRGNIAGTKNTETGTDKGSITVQLLQGGTVIATTTTDTYGNFAFNNIPIGTYTVHEVLSSGSKYYPVNNDQNVTVTYGGTANVSITNNLKRGDITGTKQTETGADKGNITIQLLQGSTVIATTTTDANGSFKFTNIPIGNYIIHEVLPGESKYYPVSNDIGVTVTFNGNAVTTITNNLKRGNIAGTKTTETGVDKGGITIQLLQNGSVFASTTTADNGSWSFNSIPIGNYVIHEVLPDESIYYPVNNDQNVTVTFNGTSNISITNNLKRGDIIGTKTTDTGVDKKGWTIQLIRDNYVHATTTTDDNGAFSFLNVPIGTYTIHEVVPDGCGYLATTNDVTVTVPFNASVNAEIKNTLIRGNIRLMKLDGDKLTQLSGAVFKITDARGQVHTMQEISAGLYYAPGIAFGVATVKEITPPTGFLLNEKEYTVNITENGKTYDLTDDPYNGIPNDPIPGSGTAGKISTNGITAEGYAMTIWTDRTGTVAPVTHYLKSDADGKFFVTDPTFAIPSGGKTYTISGLYDGDYKITEFFSSSDYQAAYTQSIQITVTDANGNTAYDHTYSKADLTVTTVNGTENYETPVFAVTGLNGGGHMTVTVTNHPIPGSVEIKKTSTDGEFLDGYAFKLEHSNADAGQAVSYWRSDENGKFYLTDSSYAEVTSGQNYLLSNIYDGSYTIRELIGSSTWQYSRMDAIRFTVTDKAGTVTFDQTVSGTDLTQENNDFILSQPISIAGVNGGGKLTIEVINTPLPATVTVNKVNHADQPLEGAKFLLEWSKDGTTWTQVTFNAEEKIFIGGCQSPNLDAEGCLISDHNGKIEFIGLHPMMQYRLVEVEAPNGYVLLAEAIPVGTLFDDFQEHFRVVNGTIYSLPNTGSTGTTSVVTGGAAIVAMAALILVFTLCMTPRAMTKQETNQTKVWKKGQKHMKKHISRIMSVVLILALLASIALPTFAASWDASVIDMGAAASITLHKYDWTNAVKDGVWDASYVSTGVKDTNVEQILGGEARANGDLNGEKDHPLANGNVSNGYAVSGVEFSYLRVADIAHFTENITNGVDSYHDTRVLYGFNKVETADLLTAIGLAGGAEAFTEATTSRLPSDCWWYESDTLNAALADALANDVTGVKDALETYINSKLGTVANGGQADLHTDANNRYDGGRMLFTDQNGYTAATNLETGLYILVETKVPESTTNGAIPAFISLPMTRVNGGYGMTGAANETEGGHSWNYDVELYPKNESGIVTLTKLVREVKADGGKNNASDVLSDGFAHNATASTGDLVEYQITSTLPAITSQATRLTTYQFNDSIASGLTYTEAANVKLQWYTDKDCTNLVDTWTYDEGYFSVTTDNDNHKREIALTEDGLAIVNGLAAASNNVNSGTVKYARYSNYTVRITYTAKLDSDKTFLFGDKGNTNQVILTWRRTASAYFDTLVDDCHVYSYALDLTKKFSDKTQDEAYGDGSEAQNMFNHAKFKVRNVTAENGIYTEGYFVIAEKNEAEGIWYVTGHSDKEDDATIFYPLKPSNYDGDEGHIIIKGLEDDTYELTEIETANGYTLLKDRITVKISVEETADYCSVYDNEVKTGVYQNDGHYNYTGCPDLPLANIPQQGKAHHLLTASATVDGNPVSMNADYDPANGNAIVVGTNANGEYLYSQNAIVPLTVVNTHGFDLPQTGHVGANYLPLIGASLFAIASVGVLVTLFVLPRRKADEE